MEDIHGYKRRLECLLRRIRESSMLAANKRSLLAFYELCLSEGISPGKIGRYLPDMKTVSDLLKKRFVDATRKDIQRVLAEIEKRDWSPHTKHGFKVVLKKFYRWLRGIDEPHVYPEEVRWISTNMKVNHRLLPEDLVTDEEVSRMLSACSEARNKAFLACLFETGCRITELATIKLKNVVFDEYGAVLVVNNSKSGGRRVRMVFAASYLRDWLNNHPRKDDSEAFVWVDRRHQKLLGYTRLAEILKGMAKAAGVKKRIYPHLFRHSRATFLAKRLPEPTVKRILGWSPTSRMINTYVHLSGKDTDDAVLSLYGIKGESANQESSLKPRVCTRCGEGNQATNKFCGRCSLPLDEEVRNRLLETETKEQEMHELMNELIKDEEFFGLLATKLGEIKSSKRQLKAVNQN